MQAKKYISQLKYQWISIYLLQAIAISLGLALLFGSLVRHFTATDTWIYFVVFVIAFTFFLFVKKIWKIDDGFVIRYLDSNFPKLEESSFLLLKSEANLGLLEQLQIEKISTLLPQNKIIGIKKLIWQATLILVIGIASFFAIAKIASNTKKQLAESNLIPTEANVIENVPPQVDDYTISITPPAYTGNGIRKQNQFYIKAETEAIVKWELKTNKKVKSLIFIFNDKERVKLSPTQTNANTWVYTKKAEKQGFYQLELDGVKSDLYQIDVIPDLPVTIKIAQPKPQTTIDIGEPKFINLKANLTDDYGIVDASISATMASGKGESVSFTEKKLAFNTKFGGAKKIELTKQIDLKALGMKPGDELYFFVNAKDSKGQQSRSDVYFVSIVDTTELMSMAGMTSGVNLVPEYFRSERQIIIDTEKLLAEQNSISATDFKTRSNELGVDQKLLRLRYGQFLGEENETQIGGDDEHHEGDGHNHSTKEEPEKFGDVQAMMDKYAHKHDIAEDATFFEPEIKAQLKAVLNEMWKAELKLRTYKPQEALPFEYKALRLLKDLQQKSRAYVAKTTVKTSALKPEKRLTGELDKIVEPRQILNLEAKDQTSDELRIILSLLNAKQGNRSFSYNEKALLKTAEKQIIIAASSNPSTYLNALKTVKKLNTQNSLNNSEIVIVSKAIYQILGYSTAKPSTNQVNSSKTLASYYFNNLKKY